MLNVIRTAGIFMIIAQTLYHFVSGSKYARYVRLLIRIMTLAVLIVPLLDLIKSGTQNDFDAKLAQFEYEYEMLLRDTGYADDGVMEEQIARAAAEEIKTTLDPVLAPYGYEVAGVYAGEDSLLFTLSSMGERAAGSGVRPVREVNIHIGDESAGGETDKVEDESAQNGPAGTVTPDASELSGVIAAYLGIERSRVEVRILA